MIIPFLQSISQLLCDYADFSAAIHTNHLLFHIVSQIRSTQHFSNCWKELFSVVHFRRLMNAAVTKKLSMRTMGLEPQRGLRQSPFWEIWGKVPRVEYFYLSESQFCLIFAHILTAISSVSDIAKRSRNAAKYCSEPATSNLCLPTVIQLLMWLLDNCA